MGRTHDWVTTLWTEKSPVLSSSDALGTLSVPYSIIPSIGWSLRDRLQKGELNHYWLCPQIPYDSNDLNLAPKLLSTRLLSPLASHNPWSCIQPCYLHQRVVRALLNAGAAENFVERSCSFCPLIGYHTMGTCLPHLGTPRGFQHHVSSGPMILVAWLEEGGEGVHALFPSLC